jgi:hypothetical protein
MVRHLYRLGASAEQFNGVIGAHFDHVFGRLFRPIKRQDGIQSGARLTREEHPGGRAGLAARGGFNLERANRFPNNADMETGIWPGRRTTSLN